MKIDSVRILSTEELLASGGVGEVDRWFTSSAMSSSICATISGGTGISVLSMCGDLGLGVPAEF